jgi:hypothetical protein
MIRQPIITDSEYRVLVVTPERKHLLWLVEGECDCQLYQANGDLSTAELESLKARPWEWVYKPSQMSNNLVKTGGTDVMVRSQFLQQKLWAYYDILNLINYARARVSPVVNQQDMVYLEKERQARLVRNGITEDCQMVKDYAEFASCTLTQAADQILFKAELARDSYANTERLRMSYLRDLRKCTSVEEIQTVRDRMHRESWLNVLL